jgi:hypothetical protein
MVDGQILVRDGRLTQADGAEITATGATAARELAGRAAL